MRVCARGHGVLQLSGPRPAPSLRTPLPSLPLLLLLPTITRSGTPLLPPLAVLSGGALARLGRQLRASSPARAWEATPVLPGFKGSAQRLQPLWGAGSEGGGAGPRKAGAHSRLALRGDGQRARKVVTAAAKLKLEPRTQPDSGRTGKPCAAPVPFRGHRRPAVLGLSSTHARSGFMEPGLWLLFGLTVTSAAGKQAGCLSLSQQVSAQRGWGGGAGSACVGS